MIKHPAYKKNQCRYCTYFRFGDITVIPLPDKEGETFDGYCLMGMATYPIVPVNCSYGCGDFKPRGG